MLIKRPQLCRLVPNRTSGGSRLSRSPIVESQQGLLVTTQHSLGSQNKPTVSLPASLSASLSANQNAAFKSKLRTEKLVYGEVKWTHRSPVNQRARIQEVYDTKTSGIKLSLGLKLNIKITQRSTEKDIKSTAN